MDYELAKELKDAGYPEPNPNLGRGLWAAGDFKETGVYLPTLPELIEACGDGFDTLYRTNGRWYAIGYTRVKRIDIDGIELDCNSPEEAVARLWLALNKVDTNKNT